MKNSVPLSTFRMGGNLRSACLYTYPYTNAPALHARTNPHTYAQGPTHTYHVLTRTHRTLIHIHAPHALRPYTHVTRPDTDVSAAHTRTTHALLHTRAQHARTTLTCTHHTHVHTHTHKYTSCPHTRATPTRARDTFKHAICTYKHVRRSFTHSTPCVHEP